MFVNLITFITNYVGLQKTITENYVDYNLQVIVVIPMEKSNSFSQPFGVGRNWYPWKCCFTI